MPSDITIFEVRRIHTMNPARPTATHVAVRDGRVLMVGDAAEVAGLGSIEAVTARLAEASASIADPDKLLYGWGFDPLHLGGARLIRHDLDRISTTRPVMVHHASLHITNVQHPPPGNGRLRRRDDDRRRAEA